MVVGYEYTRKNERKQGFHNLNLCIYFHCASTPCVIIIFSIIYIEPSRTINAEQGRPKKKLGLRRNKHVIESWLCLRACCRSVIMKICKVLNKEKVI